MKSSSFLCGVLLGATAVVLASRRNKGWMNMIGQAGSVLKSATMKNGQNGQNGQNHVRQSAGSGTSGAAATAQVYPSSVSSSHAGNSQEYNLNQIKDFIKSSPDVRREVEAILKETHTVIPGL
ncbi:hypothetical protein V3851_00950 [Paenibacillus sp. M1]|uniref:Uncharacterized protein n=1 Tax=Paenibacillus haidiansis TaxID=1574488 RepID=A0ABU7VND0_9BACL